MSGTAAGQWGWWRRRNDRRSGQAGWLALLAILPVALLVGVVAIHAVELVFSAKHRQEFVEFFSNPAYYRVLCGTAVFAFLSTAVALVFGVPIAWFAERVAGRSARWIRLAMIVGTIVPGFFIAMGWLLLGHPRIGFLTQLGLPINITSLGGMAFAQGLALASLVFVMMAPSMAALSRSLEESAAVHGMGRYAIWRYVWLPLLRPALIATASVIFLVSFAAFDIPAVLGLSNRVILYSTFIYELITPVAGLPQYGLATASSIPVLLMAVLFTLINIRYTRAADAFAVVGGKTQDRALTPPGRAALASGWLYCGVFMLISFVLPLLAVTWASLLPFYRPPSVKALSLVGLGHYRELFSTQFWSAAKNTVLFATLAPTVALVLSFMLCWSSQRVSRASRYAIDIMTFLPLAIPSAVLAVGAITLALFLGSWVPIYGTMLLIILVEAVARLPIATRAIGAALLQIHKELDEAGAVFGLRAANRAWRITLPLILPALLYSWFLLAILAFRELTVPIMLASKDSITLSVYTFGLLSTGSFGRAAALTLVVLVVLALLALLATLASRMLGRNAKNISDK